VTGIALLAGTRVLDFGAAPLAYAGRIFVELGAEVVLVEPPGGLALRAAPPLVPTGDGATVSATFCAYAVGKRSVTIDESTPEGRALRDRLVTTADVALVPTDPAEARRRGLDEPSLRALHDGLVVVSATPFGLTGPRRNWKGSDTTAWAASGLTYQLGDPDRPPVVAPLGLADAVTSLNAAMGAMLALRARARSAHHRGQLVDVSAQEAALSVMMEAGPQHAIEGQVPERVPRARMAGIGLYETADGAVDVTAFLPPQWDALAAWIAEELGIDEATLDVFRGPITARVPFNDVINGWINELASRYDKQAFFLEAQRRGLPAGAVNEVGDLLHDHHLRAIGAWHSEDDDDEPRAGGVACRLPVGPLVVDGARAVGGPIPEPGAHDDEVLGPLRG